MLVFTVKKTNQTHGIQNAYFTFEIVEGAAKLELAYWTYNNAPIPGNKLVNTEHIVTMIACDGLVLFGECNVHNQAA